MILSSNDLRYENEDLLLRLLFELIEENRISIPSLKYIDFCSVSSLF
jgi:hypothetical protein